MKKGHTGVHINVQLCKGGRADMESVVGMHTCTDACRHSEEGVVPDER